MPQKTSLSKTDQWKLEGNCDQCRRQSYCKKMCRTAQIAMWEKAVREKFQEYLKDYNNDKETETGENTDE